MAEVAITLSDVISIVEGYAHQDEKLELAKSYLEDNLSNIGPADHEKRGEFYYYLLRIMLEKNIPFETPMALNYYQRMTESFSEQEKVFLKELNLPTDLRKASIRKSQLKAFYKLMEKYYSVLENLYNKRGFVEARDRAYEKKMTLRKNRYKIEKNMPSYVAYLLLENSSRYGLSFMRWGLTTLVIILVFSFLFALVDVFSVAKVIPQNSSFGFDYVYYSIVNFTTLGYGDFVPHTIIQKLLVCAEVFIGYTMLGMFINLIFKKL